VGRGEVNAKTNTGSSLQTLFAQLCGASHAWLTLKNEGSGIFDGSGLAVSNDVPAKHSAFFLSGVLSAASATTGAGDPAFFAALAFFTFFPFAGGLGEAMGEGAAGAGEGAGV